MTTSIKHEQDEIIREFSALTDWMDKYEHLIELGKSLAPMEYRYRNDSHSVAGCQSTVWIRVNKCDNIIHVSADSDTMITKGLIVLIVRVYNNKTPEEILDEDLYFIREIGLRNNLSPSRVNGLLSIINHIKKCVRDLV